MFLSTEDKRMLDGAHGPGVQRAMDLLVKLGESFDSEKMTELSYVHAIYDVIPQDYWDLITEGATKGLKVTTHPAFQPENVETVRYN